MAKKKPTSGMKLSAKNIAAGFLMAILAISLLGFGVDGFGGRTTSIGSVGGRNITTDEYARALQNELRALQAQFGQPVTMEQARMFGLDQAVLEQLVTGAALKNEADRLGISVGDSIVQEEILQVSAFLGAGGQFDREAYRFALQSAGLTEAEFERSIRDDVARTILQMAVMGIASSPEALVDTVMDFQAQSRDISVLTLGSDALDAAIPRPTDAELQAYYEENIARYTLAEGKRIRYAWLTPDMLLDSIEVDQDILRDAYERAGSRFRQPERRLVERLVFPDMAAAERAMARIEAGETSFEALVTERGLSLDDADMGDVTFEQLREAGAAVFALTEPGVIGPVSTALGPAIFNMSAILSAQQTSFEDAIPELREELALDRARRILSDDLDLYEDLLAGGATIQQLADETDMRSGTIDWRQGDSSGIAAYEAFRDAARRLQPDDFPEIMILYDGGLFALELIETIPATPQPLDDIRTQVITDWRNARLVELLRLRGTEIKQQLEAGAEFSDLNLTPDSFEGLMRSDFLPGLPRDIIAAVFEMQPGDLRMIEGSREVYLVMLHSIAGPDLLMEDVMRFRGTLAEQLTQSLEQDLFTYFAGALRDGQPIQLDQRVIDAVQANF